MYNGDKFGIKDRSQDNGIFILPPGFQARD